VLLSCPSYADFARNETGSTVKLHTGLTMHSRIDNRYRLRCLALCQWETSDGYLRNICGETRDISTHGAFVITDPCPPLGTEIDLKVLLPNLDGAKVGMRLQGKGKVLRVERGSTTGINGFATSVQLCPAVPDGAAPSSTKSWDNRNVQ
jgi:hypothetical protein